MEVYDFTNKTFRGLEITECEPWAFYEKKNSLICKDKSDNNFYFVNVKTLEKEKLNIKKPKMLSRCVIVADDHDCLIYSKVRLHFLAEKEDMYIYWIDEKKEQKYLKDVFIWSGVYISRP